MHRYLKSLTKINISDLDSVGGKNASLGEMMNDLNKLNIRCPQGYALTTEAYSDFIKENEIAPYLQSILSKIDLSNTKQIISNTKKLILVKMSFLLILLTFLISKK